LVSICLPNLNMRPFLDERMQSILDQTFTDWELIVCDSYSEDGAWEFFQKFAGDRRVRLYQVPRKGVYAGWNECLRRTTGKYVYIATSDDTAQPGLLDSLMKPLECLPQVMVAVCDFENIDEASRSMRSPFADQLRSFYGDWMLRPCLRNGKTEFLTQACFGQVWYSMTTVLFRRDLIDRIGLFREDIGSVADVEWAMRASLMSDVAFVPGRLATWRVHQNQATPGGWRQEMSRQILASLKRILHDPVAGIPADWRRIPQWDHLIARVWETEYCDGFQLYRGSAKRQPGQFLINFLRATALKPQFALHQLCRGFSWSGEFSLDKTVAASGLVKIFGVPWPPQDMSSGWSSKAA
jgi:glycosyltransferase involved in cell wall biosynthesis